MATKIRRKPGRDAVELRYEAGGPIPVADLSDSLSALDRVYRETAGRGESLAVAELRSGSVIAVLVPFLPLLGQALPALDAALTVSDFTDRFIRALNAFSGRADGGNEATTDKNVIAELAEVLKPLKGRERAQFGMAHIKYRSRSKSREVKVEATYGAAEIDRAVINAERHAHYLEEASRDVSVALSEPTLLRKARLAFHQANSGPAKIGGRTGDRGVIEIESSDSLPVYFAPSITDLKGHLVKGQKNPLKGSYIVDAVVTRVDGLAKSYTIVAVHGPARQRVIKKNEPLLLASTPSPKPDRRQRSIKG